MFSLKKSEEILYNKIIFLSRNKLLYEEFGLKDTFQNRINLIFIHISFIFIKIKNANSDSNFKNFYQKMFNFIFKKVELNMRELGFGDTNVNKKMKFLVKSFYNILLTCENYKKDSVKQKKIFLTNYFSFINDRSENNSHKLIDYFDKYCSFCLDLSTDNVLKGELNFNYK
jgi:cytochrome b pre-mRNA-processing protein 3